MENQGSSVGVVYFIESISSEFEKKCRCGLADLDYEICSLEKMTDEDAEDQGLEDYLGRAAWLNFNAKLPGQDGPWCNGFSIEVILPENHAALKADEMEKFFLSEAKKEILTLCSEMSDRRA